MQHLQKPPGEGVASSRNGRSRPSSHSRWRLASFDRSTSTMRTLAQFLARSPQTIACFYFSHRTESKPRGRSVTSDRRLPEEKTYGTLLILCLLYLLN